nr:LamG domain-containing protein [Leptolyngbya sp. FACHB-1624]
MNKSDTSWEAIDICNHRIEKYRNLISFYLTFKPLPQGRTDILEVSGEQQGKLQDIKIIPDKEFGFCADFDGDKSYIEFATSQMPLKNEPYSIEVWIKPAEMKDCHIVGWGNSIGNNSANLLNLTPEGIRNSWGQTNTGKVAQKKLDDGQWHYVVATFDGKTRSIYVDSKELVKDDKLSQLAIADAQKLRIGKIDPAKLPAFKGKIALIRICGRSLTIDEIRRYHLLDKLNHITSPADPHLQLHLRLNELRQGLKPTTQEVQDFSGNERHGLVKENQPAPEVMADDRFGSCLNFKSTSGAISINSIPALPENKSFTIVLSVKVQPEEKQSDAIILQWGNDFKIVQKGNPWELTLTLQNNQKLTFDNSTNLTKFADGRWHQLAIIYNHQLPDISLYLDQIWVASKSIKLGAISSPLLEIAP